MRAHEVLGRINSGSAGPARLPASRDPIGEFGLFALGKARAARRLCGGNTLQRGCFWIEANFASVSVFHECTW